MTHPSMSPGGGASQCPEIPRRHHRFDACLQQAWPHMEKGIGLTASPASSPEVSQAVVRELLRGADDADTQATEREEWAAASARQADAYQQEAAYLRAYAAEARGLAESKAPRGKHAQAGEPL